MSDEIMQDEQIIEQAEKLAKRMLDGLKKECDAFFGGHYFFENTWRSAIENNVKQVIELDKLVKWIDGRLADCEIPLLYFCPADKTDKYTNGMFCSFKGALGEWALLKAMRNLLTCPLCTDAQRQNIEYTLKKEYGLRYNPIMQVYCAHKDDNKKENDENETSTD